MKIRPLTADDAGAWKVIRLEMLREHPEAFGEDVEDFEARDEKELCTRIADGHVIGAFSDGVLIGTVGWFPGHGRKRRHVAEIWGMYVTPTARRTGAGRLLLKFALSESAEAGISVWELGVEENNHGARNLYESEGFKAWGTEPDAYRLPDASVNVVHMTYRAQNS